MKKFAEEMGVRRPRVNSFDSMKGEPLKTADWEALENNEDVALERTAGTTPGTPRIVFEDMVARGIIWRRFSCAYVQKNLRLL